MEKAEVVNGTVAVVEGQFIVTDPTEGGVPAIIYPPDSGGVIFKNGSTVQEPTDITSEDTIDYKGLREEKPSQIDIDLTPDEMECYITVYAGTFIGYQPIDMPPVGGLKPVFKPKVTDYYEPKMEDVELELTKRFVSHGVNNPLLSIVAKSANGRRTLIAEGTPPVPGVDGYVEYKMDIEPKKREFAETENIDFRDIYVYPEVNEGDLIAVIHPPVEGKSGLTVTGQQVNPRPVREAKYFLKGFVEAQGDRIVATHTGRLFVNYNTIEVTNILIHRGDVSLKTGNVKFNGDIHVSGDVNEDMNVAAMLDLKIKGNIYSAHIQSGHNAELAGNNFNSDLEIGVYRMKYYEMFMGYEVVQEKYADFLRNYAKKKYSNFNLAKGYIKQLVEKDLHTSAEQIEEIGAILNNNKYFSNNKTNDIVAMRTNLQNMQNLLEVKNIMPSTIPQIDNEINSILDFLRVMMADVPGLSCKNVQSCKITCGGHVKIIGSGAYHSDIKCLGDVKINGYFRGGSIYAHGNISVNELSIIQVNANEPEISVAEGSTIEIKNLVEPLVVRIGDALHPLQEGPSGLIS